MCTSDAVNTRSSYFQLISAVSAINLERMDRPPVSPDDMMLADDDPRVTEWLGATETTPYLELMMLKQSRNGSVYTKIVRGDCCSVGLGMVWTWGRGGRQKKTRARCVTRCGSK